MHPRAHSWADDSGQGSAAALFSSWVEMKTQGKPVKSWHQNLSNLYEDVYCTERLKSRKVIFSILCALQNYLVRSSYYRVGTSCYLVRITQLSCALKLLSCAHNTIILCPQVIFLCGQVRYNLWEQGKHLDK